MKYLVVLSLVMTAFAWLGFDAFAQDVSSKEPVVITADDALDWDRANNQFIARGAAVAKQGSVSVAAETLTAHYIQTPQSDFDMQRLTADGYVVLRSDQNVAYGQNMIYDLKASYAILTGKAPRIQTPDQLIVAQERLEYFVEEGRLEAAHGAEVTRGSDRLSADKMTAYLSQARGGKRRLDKVIATGRVTIITPQETVTGQKGIYNARANEVELLGGVTIKRGANILTGQRALVDLSTQMSHLYGADKNGASKGRVSGTFYPSR